MKCVILPEENRKDFADLPDCITKDLEFYFADNYTDVFRIAFPDLIPPS
jgi:ATP-dependent Lon protease